MHQPSERDEFSEVRLLSGVPPQGVEVLYVDAAAPRRLVTSMAAPSCSSAKALVTASLVERHYH
jgi:hypothetical protein